MQAVILVSTIHVMGVQALYAASELVNNDFLVLPDSNLDLVEVSVYDAVDDFDAAEVGAGVAADFLEPHKGVFAQVVLRGGIADHETVAEIQGHQL
jgi:hypothetical protein